MAAAPVAARVEGLLGTVGVGYKTHLAALATPMGTHVVSNRSSYTEVDCSNVHNHLRTACCRTCTERYVGT